LEQGRVVGDEVSAAVDARPACLFHQVFPGGPAVGEDEDLGAVGGVGLQAPQDAFGDGLGCEAAQDGGVQPVGVGEKGERTATARVEGDL
jgi:hypothetical protein